MKPPKMPTSTSTGSTTTNLASHKAAMAGHGVKLTFMPYFVQATIAGLRAVPEANSRFTDEGIVISRRIHMGMAAAVDKGLIVPVIHNADELNLQGLARVINDLTERARTGKLHPDELQGGTFTLTNHGSSGSLIGAAIINQPQAGLPVHLGLGRGKDKGPEPDVHQQAKSKAQQQAPEGQDNGFEPGMVIQASERMRTTASSGPPMNPEANPKIMPISTPTVAAIKPTLSERGVATSSSASISRPLLSVPSGCSGDPSLNPRLLSALTHTGTIFVGAEPTFAIWVSQSRGP
jgi:hypothetical protein